MGDYTVTREHFLESRLVEYKILQEGVYVVDSDVNEQWAIQRNQERRLIHALAGRSNVRIGKGFSFKVGGTNNVAVWNGDCLLEIENTNTAIHVWSDSDTGFSSWTTPSGSDRTDFIYLDIYFECYDSDDDATLITPEVGEESMVDIRRKVEWKTQEGGSFPSAPADHTYIKVMTINRLDGNNQITEAMCVNELEDRFAYLKADGTVDLDGAMNVNADLTVDANIGMTAGKTVDGVDVSVFKTDYETFRDDYREVIFMSGHTRAHDDTTNPPTADYKFRVPNDGSHHILANRTVYKSPNVNKIRAKIRYTWGSMALNFKLEHVGGNSDSKDYESSGGYLEFVIDVSSVSDGDEMTINFSMMCLSATNSEGFDLNIWGAYS